MGSRCSARLLTSLVLTAGIALAYPQAFGRFGYVDSWSIPGLVLTRSGFRSEHPAADTFRFTQPLRLWKPIQTSDMGQTVNVGEFAGSPSKLRQDLTAPGILAHFPKGIRLTLASNAGPFLTWSPEGSMEANTGYATPPSKWVVVSFRDNQPPVLLTFIGAPSSLRLTGRPGDWLLTGEDSFAGWVRISCPIGGRAFATNAVGDLGRLVVACQDGIALADLPPPLMTGLQVTDEGPGLLAEWKFDRPGAVVPFPVFLAAMGGYSVQLASKIKRLDMNTGAGPTFITEEPRLALRFTVRRVPTGRAVLMGTPTGDSIGTTSHLDHAGVSEMALANLVSTQERASRELAVNTVGEFVSEATYSLEPHTGQRLPFNAEGVGLDLSAAHAFLLQTTLTTSKPTSEPNSLLTSLLWRRDWLTWQLACPDDKRRRRAGALLSIAAALASEPERRLDGAMLHAGLAAERGLAIWKQRTQAGPPPAKLLETFADVRADLFAKEDYRRQTGFGRAILSELRSFGDVPISVFTEKGKRMLQWKATDTRSSTITFASAYPIEVIAAKNLASLEVSQGLGFTILRVTAKDAGECVAEIKTPEWAAPLPAWMPTPRYAESES